MRNVTGIPHSHEPAADAPKITIEYGHRVAGARPYRVEFALRGAMLVSRYLDPRTPWEEREIDLSNAHILRAITTTLEAYGAEAEPLKEGTA